VVGGLKVINTRVRWSHAWVGGLLVAAGIELAKKGLTVYLGMVPTYSAVYGAFATVPILLIWIYLAWVIVLLGAVITASLPSLGSGLVWRHSAPGWRFQLALDALAALHSVQTTHKGWSLEQLCTQLRVDPQHLEPVLDVLVALDWVGQLQEISNSGPRYVLLAVPALTPLAPLAERLLLPQSTSAVVWQSAGLQEMRLSQALPQP
jgi:membrane protein